MLMVERSIEESIWFLYRCIKDVIMLYDGSCKLVSAKVMYFRTEKR